LIWVQALERTKGAASGKVIINKAAKGFSKRQLIGKTETTKEKGPNKREGTQKLGNSRKPVKGTIRSGKKQPTGRPPHRSYSKKKRKHGEKIPEKNPKEPTNAPDREERCSSYHKSLLFQVRGGKEGERGSGSAGFPETGKRHRRDVGVPGKRSERVERGFSFRGKDARWEKEKVP